MKHFFKVFVPLLVILLSLISQIEARQINTWNAITAFDNIKEITVAENNRIWGISNGGLFEFSNNQYEQLLTTVDGLHRLEANTISYLSSNKQIVVGYIDGMIDLVDIETKEIRQIQDINRVESFPAKSVNKFVVSESRLFVATSFGIVVYNLESFLVEDSFTKIGSFNRGSQILDVFIENGKIFTAGQQGVAVADINSNLNLESTWVNYSVNDFFNGESVQKIVKFQDRLFASTASGNFELVNNLWVQSSLFGSNNIIKFRRQNSYLLSVTSSGIIIVDEGFNTIQFNPASARISDANIDAEGQRIITSTASNGLEIISTDTGESEIFKVDGPNLNFFSNIKFDNRTIIAGSTPRSERDVLLDNLKGYFINKEGKWENFNRSNTEVLDQFGFRQAFTTAITENYFYFGSWGQGIARHDKITDEIMVFDQTNSTIRGWEADDPNFPVMTGLDSDENNLVWAVSRFGSTPLYVQEPGSDEWIALNKSSVILSNDEYESLFIDSNNQLWVTLKSTSLAGRGIVVIQTNGSTDDSNHQAVKLTDSPDNGNLPDNSVTAILEDLDGEIWVGTERGISRFSLPEFIISGSPAERRGQWLLNSDPNAESPFLLRDIQVTDMAVNSANQKWIGTINEGVWLLNAEGNRILKHFTSENSPLLSNSIQSINVQNETGQVYIATDVGLVVFNDIPTQPVSSPDELKVFPNPFLYDRHDEIFIEGLGDENTVRILTVNGKVIKRLDARGGRISWDGFDENGNKVSSGVYMVISIDSDGNERGVGKVVIVKS